MKAPSSSGVLLVLFVAISGVLGEGTQTPQQKNQKEFYPTASIVEAKKLLKQSRAGDIEAMVDLLALLDFVNYRVVGATKEEIKVFARRVKEKRLAQAKELLNQCRRGDVTGIYMLQHTMDWISYKDIGTTEEEVMRFVRQWVVKKATKDLTEFRTTSTVRLGSAEWLEEAMKKHAITAKELATTPEELERFKRAVPPSSKRKPIFIDEK